jgi:SAM-dependent methyltransferase
VVHDLSTSGTTSLSPRTPAWWDARYRCGEAPWDTGVVPPEIAALASAAVLSHGWALDLGCGSGLNSRYLTRWGYRVVGVDLALTPLSRAVRSARDEGSPARFCAGDATDLSFLRLQARLAVDIGCLHAVHPDRRQRYIASLADHLLPGAFYLLYAFEPSLPSADGPAGLGPQDMAAFAPHFRLRWAQHGHDRDRPSAWYLLQRT